MKVRKVFESMDDPDDMFEVFKDIVDDVLLTEFDRELDYEFKKGQIEITHDIEINLESGDYQEICYSDNWGFQFTMPDERRVKDVVKKRIANLFERKTGQKIKSYELGISASQFMGYRNPIVKILFSKPEWIEWSVNLKDFEEDTRYVELPSKYSDIKVIGGFDIGEFDGRRFRVSEKSLNFIFEISNGVGLKVQFKRGENLKELNIKQGEMEYDVFYSLFYFGNKGDEKNKQRIIKASEELNSNSNIFLVDLYDDQEENMERFVEFLSKNVLPKIQSHVSKLIEDIEEQFKKLEEEDNIIIDIEISRYKKDNSEFVVYLCETELKGEQYIFKFTLDVNKSEIIIHSNDDENNDGSDLIKCQINELSDCIFLCLADGKFQSQ